MTERRILSSADGLEEALFTGLRLTAGLDIGQVGAKYGVDVWARYGVGLRPFIERGWLVQERDRLRLTRDGMLMANEVMGVFV